MKKNLAQPSVGRFSGSWEDKEFKQKGIYYLCVTQKDGEKAWSSPVWVHL